jgi:hypothetical protein
MFTLAPDEWYLLAFGYDARYFNLIVEMIVLLRCVRSADTHSVDSLRIGTRVPAGVTRRSRCSICKLFVFVELWKHFLEMFVRISSAIGATLSGATPVYSRRHQLAAIYSSRTSRFGASRVVWPLPAHRDGAWCDFHRRC